VLRQRRRAADDRARDSGDDEESFFRGPSGTAVVPGTYQVTLVVGGKRYTKPVLVKYDPRIELTPAQVTAQHDAAVNLERITQRVNRVIGNSDNILAQLTNLQSALNRAPRTANTPTVLAQVDSTIKDLRHFRDSVLARPLAGLGYRQYPRLREEVQSVSRSVSGQLWPITAGETLRSNELKEETDDAQGRLDQIINIRVGKINQLLAGTEHVITPGPRGVIP